MAKKVRTIDEEINKVIQDFCEAYNVQKGTDLDEIEMVIYEQGKKTIIYFRKKRTEIRKYGAEVQQDS